MSATKRNIYCFGAFRVDASRRVLRSEAGEVIELSSRAFDALLYLIEHPGQLLEKTAIIEAVWPNVVVEDNNLNQAIFAIRRALSDSADKPCYVATVPGRGFQFVAPVTTLDPEIGHDHDGASSHPGAPHRTSARLGWPIAAALLVGAVFAAALSPTLLRGRAPIAHTLAVLPFRPLMPGVENAALEFGMTDTLITLLSQARGLNLTAFSSVRGYGAIDQDPLAAGRELGVDSVLVGYVSGTGDRLRVSVQLIDATNGSTRWEREFDRLEAEQNAVQDEIAREVVAQLPGDIVGRADMHVLRGAGDPETFNLYSLGRTYWVERTPAALELAIDKFKEVIARDPRHTLAYSGLADCYAVLAVLGAREPHEAFREARKAAQIALDLDPNLAEAHATIGHIHVQYDLDWDAGEREYREAIALNSQYSMAYMWLGMLYNYQGRFDEALEYMRAAQRLEPTQPVFSANIANVLYHAHRYDEAIEQLGYTLAMDENFDLALAFLGRAYLRKGDVDSAIEMFERRRSQLLGKDADLVQAYAQAGRQTEARDLLERMHEQAKTKYVSPYELSAAYISLGNEELALQYLETAHDERAQHIAHLPQDPAFEELHDHPRFEALVERLGL